MCQLLGMNANKPASLHFSLAGFLCRGGRTGEHSDGWGAAYFDGPACRLLVETAPSADSALADWLHRQPLRSRNIIAHVRKATRGAVALENCHPFVRELWGRQWAFAHNGNLKDPHLPLRGRFTPVGTTDSEHAFCYLLETLVRQFGHRAPQPAALYAALAELAREISACGSFNFLLSDGAGLFAHCSTTLHVLERGYPFSRARRVDDGVAVELGHHNHLDDRMCLVATAPLTEDESWQALQPGELRYFRDGRDLPQGVEKRAPLLLAV
ncbi:class II glutamine amidotransferase [Pseudothauera nasutitermitis]|uniref:Class II glutamine amidotransferase n=1 Tax=Pseudothauera nasutitermitis TaxID=2565930 RepID=A0A4S4B3U4_9RHOO|nr:class II glutamine amidotransferase [Pseudothauera nasutitermitis]THF67357.1 class II glutamine amidotransferase [Pseudothauera nasutitermitis]